MLDFSIINGVVGKLVVNGCTTDILTDVTALVSVIYGTMKRNDNDEAEDFRKGLMTLFMDRELHDKVFSTEYADMLEKSDMYKTQSATQKVDMKELMKQLKELKDLLEEEEKSDNESE